MYGPYAEEVEKRVTEEGLDTLISVAKELGLRKFNQESVMYVLISITKL